MKIHTIPEKVLLKLAIQILTGLFKKVNYSIWVSYQSDNRNEVNIKTEKRGYFHLLILDGVLTFNDENGKVYTREPLTNYLVNGVLLENMQTAAKLQSKIPSKHPVNKFVGQNFRIATLDYFGSPDGVVSIGVFTSLCVVWVDGRWKTPNNTPYILMRTELFNVLPISLNGNF